MNMFNFTEYCIKSDNAKAEEILIDELVKRGFKPSENGKVLQFVPAVKT